MFLFSAASICCEYRYKKSLTVPSFGVSSVLGVYGVPTVLITR